MSHPARAGYVEGGPTSGHSRRPNRSHPAHAGYVEGLATTSSCPCEGSSHPAHAGYVEGWALTPRGNGPRCSHPASAGYVEGLSFSVWAPWCRGRIPQARATLKGEEVRVCREPVRRVASRTGGLR